MLFIMHSPFTVWLFRQEWRIATMPIRWIMFRFRMRWKLKRLGRKAAGIQWTDRLTITQTLQEYLGGDDTIEMRGGYYSSGTGEVKE